MHRMSASLRLLLCGVLIIMSAIYAVFVARDPAFAAAIAAGYVALVISVFLLVSFWKKI